MSDDTYGPDPTEYDRTGEPSELPADPFALENAPTDDAYSRGIDHVVGRYPYGDAVPPGDVRAAGRFAAACDTLAATFRLPVNSVIVDVVTAKRAKQNRTATDDEAMRAAVQCVEDATDALIALLPSRNVLDADGEPVSRDDAAIRCACGHTRRDHYGHAECAVRIGMDGDCPCRHFNPADD